MRTIQQIDKEIDANRRKLFRLEKFNRCSAENWQKAWDKHPRLHAKEQALYRERGEAQQVRDEKAGKEAKRVERSDNAKFRKESAAKFKAERALGVAAPELLSVLKITFSGLQGDCGIAFRDMHPATWRRIEAVISKVEG